MIKFIFSLALFGFFISTSSMLVNFILYEYDIYSNIELYEKVSKICIIILSAAIVLGGFSFLLLIFALLTQA